MEEAKGEDKIYKVFALILPFGDYPKARIDWLRKNMDIVINEEIKTLSMAMMEVPDPVLIGRVTQKQVLVISWGVVYHDSLKKI